MSILLNLSFLLLTPPNVIMRESSWAASSLYFLSGRVPEVSSTSNHMLLSVENSWRSFKHLVPFQPPITNLGVEPTRVGTYIEEPKATAL